MRIRFELSHAIKRASIAPFVYYWMPVILWMGGILFFSSQPALPDPISSPRAEWLRKAIHVAEYAVLACLLYREEMLIA